MRWNGLFADLEAQLEALSARERSGEIEERTRIESARITVLDRLRPARGTTVRLRCTGGLAVSGRLERVGRDWLLLDEGGGRETLVRLAHIAVIAGLGRYSSGPDSAGPLESRLGLPHALRAVARDRSAVHVHTADAASLAGTVDRVGQDFLELAVHPVGEPRRRAAVQEVVLVRLDALVALRRETG